QGAISLPARLFSDLVQTLPDGDVGLDLEHRTQTVRVQAGRSKASVKGIAAQDFPETPTLDEATVITFDPDELALALRQATMAASKDQSRLMLTGVYFHKTGDGPLTLAAADGFRLSVVALPGVSAPQGAWLVPAESLGVVAGLIGDESVEVTADDRRIAFDTGRARVTLQQIELKFPDYQQIIPDEWATRIAFNVADAVKALKRTLVFARDAAYLVKLNVQPDAGRVGLNARSDETGDVASELDVEGQGEALETMLNAQFLLDALRACGTARAVMEFRTAREPVVIREQGDHRFTHVVMPMRVGEYESV
ncbi:MAG: DNA polymerase III subunit beta, partial [Anaerolineae bacterium]